MPSTKRLGAARLAVLLLVAALATPSGGNAAFPVAQVEVTSVRVTAVARDKAGGMRPLAGDFRVPASDPRRTIGDVEPPPPNGFGRACTDIPEPNDCERTLGKNVVTGDGHWPAGSTAIVVNEVKDFHLGDTITIGSSGCDFLRLGLTCRRFENNTIVSQQPGGEIAVIVGGDAGRNLRGPGLLRLAEGLRFRHEAGTRVVKHRTLLAGQAMLVTVPNADLAVTSGDVTVSAEMVLPQGSHDRQYPRLPLTVTADTTAHEATVSSPAGETTFFIPQTHTGTATTGPSFHDAFTEDTWYTVVVKAKNSAGTLVAMGVHRFKVLAPFFTAFARDPAGTIRRTNSVRIFGVLKENTPQATNRPADAILIDMTVTRPDGTTKRMLTHTCYDHDPAAKDPCGGDFVGYQKHHHGEFMVRYGSTGREPLLGRHHPLLDVAPSPINRMWGPKHCSTTDCTEDGRIGAMMDTFQTGTYTVTARIYNSTSPIQATLTFTVQ